MIKIQKISLSLFLCLLSSFAGQANPVYQPDPCSKIRLVVSESIDTKTSKDKAKKKQERNQNQAFTDLCHIIDQQANDIIKKGNIHSLAIAIYRDGQVYQQYYGALDSQVPIKPNDHTSYEIASISKVFTGSLAAKAVLDHKINLNDDIRTYLKEDYPNLQFEETPITIQHLVTHTLGFKDKAPQKLNQVYQKIREGQYENTPFNYSMADLLEELKTVTLDKKPGTVYVYNSVGPELMAYILEQAYQKPYSKLLQDFLQEVGLQQTYLYQDDNKQSQPAISFDEQNNKAPLLKNPLLGGSHGMISTVPDLTKWMQFQLESKSPFIQESTRLLFKEEEEGDDKGYFWDVGYGQKEGHYYGKTGTSNGVQSGLLICPDSRYGMILIMNDTAEAAQNDWGNLYNTIETNLILYPKINLVSLLKTSFKENIDGASDHYKQRKENTTQYVSGSFYLNNLGYELMNENQVEQAIKVFQLAISYDLENANLYDSLGEAYFELEDWSNSLLNYTKSMELDSKNENAKVRIEQLKQR